MIIIIIVIIIVLYSQFQCFYTDEHQRGRERERERERGQPYHMNHATGMKKILPPPTLIYPSPSHFMKSPDPTTPTTQ